MEAIHATTILCVRKDGRVAMGGDGQVTVGETVMKSHAQKVRLLKGGKSLAGFAGGVADALTLFEKFEEKMERYPGNLARAAVELAKDWRSDRVLRRLEAQLAVADKERGLLVTGNGDRTMAMAGSWGLRRTWLQEYGAAGRIRAFISKRLVKGRVPGLHYRSLAFS